jgi:2-hydroxy-3-keto-5-methylthiopentenyl-1-phosphate phosphatase
MLNDEEPGRGMKIAVQLDFDGTVTEEDVSFLLLDTYVGSRWRQYLREYSEGRISVGAFNKRVFGMMKASRETMTELVLTSDRVKIRPGFSELVDYCLRKGYKIVIVSNGLIFYIEAILKKLGINGIDLYAAENEFYPEGMKVRYIGPDGTEKEDSFKEAYTRMLRQQGYDVIYIGNGDSDIYPARQASHVFATAELLECLRQENLACIPFTDFYDVIKGLEELALA